MDIKWFDKEVEFAKPGPKPIEQFLKKFDSKTLDAKTDSVLFYLAMAQATLESKDAKDDDKKELYEEIMADVEHAGPLAYFMCVRGAPSQNTVQVLKPDDQKLGIWSGEYEPLKDVKQNVYMEMDPPVAEKIMYGDPNTDSYYLKGQLIVKGLISLAVKPRSWVSMFFEFVGRDV